MDVYHTYIRYSASDRTGMDGCGYEREQMHELRQVQMRESEQYYPLSVYVSSLLPPLVVRSLYPLLAWRWKMYESELALNPSELALHLYRLRLR